MKRLLKHICGALCFLAAGTALSHAQERNEMLLNATSLLDTPYTAGLLDAYAQEQLVFTTDEVDCMTFVENTLALSLAEDSQTMELEEEDFIKWLTNIRYRDGKIDGYPSRLHYVSDWINNGVKHGFLEDVTAVQSPYKEKLFVNYMTTHANKYPLMANSTANLSQIKAVEEALTGTEIHYIPKEYLPDEGFIWIKNGDIIAITSNTDGLDVAHMGIAMIVDKKLTLIHASSTEKKVVVSNVSLKEMLRQNKNWSGVRVIRMKKS